MGYLDNRARDYKVQTSELFGNIPVSSKDELHPTIKFKRILFAVIALGIVAGLQYVDQGISKKNAKVVSSVEVEKSDPTYFERMFCRGNRRPKFCS
jgi:hypothetical protein